MPPSSTLIAEDSEDARTCTVRLVDLRGDTPVKLAGGSFSGQVRRVVKANFSSFQYCIELQNQQIGSHFYLVQQSTEDDSPKPQLKAEPLPGISGIAHLATEMRFADDAPDRYAAIVLVSGTAQRLFPQLAAKDARTAAMFPMAFVIVDKGKIAQCWPSIAPFAALGADWRNFHRILSFRGDLLLVASSAAKTEDFYWMIDVRTGEMIALPWTKGIEGGMIAISQTGRESLFHHYTMRPDSDRMPGSVRFVTDAGVNQIICADDDLPAISGLFKGEQAIFTDGTRLWKCERTGKPTMQPIKFEQPTLPATRPGN